MSTNLDTFYNWRHKYKIWKKYKTNTRTKKLEQLKERLSKERNCRKFNLDPENFSPEVSIFEHLSREIQSNVK
jgi:hypothetical protein